MFTYGSEAERVRVGVIRYVRWWPWLISIGVHTTVLVVLSAVVFVSFHRSPDRREIVPEARLGKVDPQLPLFHQERQVLPASAEDHLAKQLEQKLASAIDPMQSRQDRLDLIASRQGGLDMIVPREGGLGLIAPRPLQPGDRFGGNMDHVAAVVPETRLFNACGNAYSVVFVVDHSASMVDVFEPLKRELKRSLSELKPMQKFHVMFYISGEPTEPPGGTLCWASERNKRRYFDFIDKAELVMGKNDPRPAIKRAVDMRPDLVYLLTDGILDNEVAGDVIRVSKSVNIKVNTIAYINEVGAGVLRRIAEQTGGLYRYVSEDQLQW